MLILAIDTALDACSAAVLDTDAARLIELAPAGQFISAIEAALATDSPEAVTRRKQASQRFTSQDRARRAFELVTQPANGFFTQQRKRGEG